MANRLKPCLHAIISDKQSAFIEGRLLRDNTLVAFEINHYIKIKTQGNDGVAGFKVDVAKAYDRLEWNYIEHMLTRFNFPTVWIQRVMKCVTTISYSFVCDGQVFGSVNRQRGIRQGDPISPYLYILCAEGLSGIIRGYEETGLLHGRKIVRGSPSISHLMFVDDYYFFFKASQTEAQVMKDILQRYERLSGQVINYDKSDVIFSLNTCDAVRMLVCECLGVWQTMKPGKYLGLPMCVGKNKSEVFGFLIDRIQGKLQGWCNKELSKHGNITLLKTTAQAVPNFWMNLFEIPTYICEEIEIKMNAFL